MLFSFFSLFIYISKNGFKIYFNNKYYYKRYYGTNIQGETNIIKELNEIAVNTVGAVPNYPVMEGNNMNNKIILIIYDSKNNKPIATNILYYFYYNTDLIVHLGLFLVDKNYQRKGLQSYLTAINIILFFIEKFFCSFFFIDIGRSATAFKQLDNRQTIYPSLKNKVSLNFKNKATDIAEKLYTTYAIIDSGVSTKSNFVKETMVIKDANIKEGGGFFQLVDNKESRKSKSNEYNKYIENTCDNFDGLIIVGKFSIFKIIANM